MDGPATPSSTDTRYSPPSARGDNEKNPAFWLVLSLNKTQTQLQLGGTNKSQKHANGSLSTEDCINRVGSMQI